MNRRGFTLIEVLISVLILFVSGSALFKFNSFIKSQFEKDIERHKLALVSSIVSGEKKYSKNKKYTFDALVKFDKIHTDDAIFLKNNFFYIESTEETPYFLFTGEDGEDYEIEYGYHYINNEKAKEKLIWLNQ